MTTNPTEAVAWPAGVEGSLCVYPAKIGFSDDGDSEYHFSGKVPPGKYWIVKQEALAEMQRRVRELADEWHGSGCYLHSQIMRDCVKELRTILAADGEAR